MLLKVVLNWCRPVKMRRWSRPRSGAAIKAYSIAVTPLIPNQPEQCPAFTFVVYLAQ
jgi:hypothetical protein